MILPYSPQVDPANGGIKVSVVGGGGGGGGLAITDETAFTEGVSTLTPSGGVYNDALGAVPSGDVAEQRITSHRALHSNLRNEAGTETGTLPVPIRNMQVGINTSQIVDGSGNGVGVTGNALNVAGTIGISSTVVLAAGSAIIGKVAVDQTAPGTTNAVQAIVGSTGGWTPYKLIAAATTNATNVKASAGTLGFVSVWNLNAAPRYLKVYNKASPPTVGSDTPVQTYIIPGNTAGAGNNLCFFVGLVLSTGISFALTTGAADADTGAVAAAECGVNFGYV